MRLEGCSGGPGLGSTHENGEEGMNQRERDSPGQEKDQELKD